MSGNFSKILKNSRIGREVQKMLAGSETLLKEIAKQAGSKYYDARSAQQLAAALKESVRTAFLVLDGKSKEEVARGQVNGDPLTLKSGQYLVRIDIVAWKTRMAAPVHLS
jgi:ElaB/YqjD/DUF883 family membrane-anchored ribosome-binding protein